MRLQKNRILVAEATGDEKRLQTAQIRLGALNREYVEFSKAAGLRTQTQRAEVVGFGRGQAARASAGAEQYYQKWSKSIGANDSIKTLAKYYDVKYNDFPRYELLKQYANDVESGWISPLSGFDNYEKLYNRIQTEIVGKRTSNGILITGQKPHFMQRVIGTMIDPQKLKNDLQIIRRSGVTIDSVKNAIFEPEIVGEILVRPSGARSIRFVGADCMVSINPDTGMLIQTNPRKKE